MAEGVWRRKKRTLVLPAALGVFVSWSDALLLPGSVVGRVGICQRECPDISFLGSRALGQFVPVPCLHLDEGKLFLVLDATWLCCRSGTAARAGRVPARVLVLLLLC